MSQLRFPEIEESILKWWEEQRVFDKSLERPALKSSRKASPRDKDFVFYDGPPFATGLPHYGHIVASLMKDVVPRFWTMRGYRVERVWGWDCHGLPIENIVEKELGTKSKKEITEMGVAKFNELCRSKVLGYVEDWKKIIRRLGRWVDMEHAYRTMDRNYMESVWWVFKQLWDKGLVYEDYRSMHICPRCETTLSQQEVSEGYKEVKDIAVVAKFLIHLISNSPSKIPNDAPVYMLAWTTTPWTLPGNVLLAVGEDVEYVVVRIKNEELRIKNIAPSPQPSPTGGEGDRSNSSPSMGEDKGGGEYLILAKARLSILGEGYEVVQEMKGKDLIGLEYEPLFPYYKDTKNAFRVVAGDFVSTEEGTGIVHIAPAFGEEDFKVGKREKIPLVQHVYMDGRFKPEVADFVGQEVKPKDDPTKTDVEIIKWLAHNGKLFAKEKIEHTYPHCWRCDTPLLNYATSSWFVKVAKVKNKAIRLAKKINWSPEHIKEGRFGTWLEGARDWSISRQRFWASVMPIWRCEGNVKFKMKNEKCGNTNVMGSVAELEKASSTTVTDLHKHIVDKITFPCAKCGGQMRRVPDVLDTWFDSGSMPYAQVHYPFENKEKFEAAFPAEFIGEGQDQTRAWFYYLHLLGAALFGKPAFKNVIVNGIVLAEDGKKMAKKLQNYPDPNDIFEKYGADALRYYLISSPVMRAENLNFSEAGVREAYNKVVSMLINVLEFYKLYAPAHDERDPSALPQDDTVGKTPSSKNILDRWIVARLHELIKEVTENMERYKLSEASRPLQDFIADLSQWYLRRSRDRFKSNKKRDRDQALRTTHYILHTLSQLMAPFMPFLAEYVWQSLRHSERLPAQAGSEESRDSRDGRDPSALPQDDGGVDSVHLTDWPKFKKAKIDTALLEEMRAARKVVELAHALRAEAKIKVRQPLGEIKIQEYKNIKIDEELLELIAQEVNVKEAVVGEVYKGEGQWIAKEDAGIKVALNTEITPELKKEGLARELSRLINDARKKAGLTPSDMVEIMVATGEGEMAEVIKEFEKSLRHATIAKTVKVIPKPRETQWSQELEIDGGGKIWLGINKIT